MVWDVFVENYGRVQIDLLLLLPVEVIVDVLGIRKKWFHYPLSYHHSVIYRCLRQLWTKTGKHNMDYSAMYYFKKLFTNTDMASSIFVIDETMSVRCQGVRSYFPCRQTEWFCKKWKI